MSKRAFYPGFRWRVLAHKRSKQNSRGAYTGESFDARSGWPLSKFEIAEKHQVLLDGDWEFDELVIDDWLHLEQMSDREWWMGLGKGTSYHRVWIEVDRNGKVTVSIHAEPHDD